MTPVDRGKPRKSRGDSALPSDTSETLRQGHEDVLLLARAKITNRKNGDPVARTRQSMVRTQVPIGEISIERQHSVETACETLIRPFDPVNEEGLEGCRDMTVAELGNYPLTV